MRRHALVASLLLLCVTAHADAQVSPRRLTTLESIRQFPTYFNLQNVLVRGVFAESGQRIVLRADDHEMDVMLGDAHTVDGLVEVRAQMIDVGRLEPSDPRLTRYTGARDPEHWPKPGEALILNVTGVQAVDTATMPSVRALALEPWKFEGQRVTITGQFRGRNLFGDLPGSPAKSKYDFVLRSADGAIWVTGLRPKAKGLDLDVDARVDTSRWVQVTGMVKRERTMVTIEAATIAGAQPPAAQPADDEPAGPPVPLLPAEVIFSSPTALETDIPVHAVIRLQFSKGLDPASIAGHIRIDYAGAAATAVADTLAFETKYDAATRSVELHLAKPADPFKTVTVATLDGLKSFDGAPVTPWTLTFTFGN